MKACIRQPRKKLTAKRKATATGLAEAVTQSMQQLAMKGGREERLILVRDTNKVVALGVLRNPRMQDDDVEFIARMRNISEEVLRQIARTRDWTKSYSVINVLPYPKLLRTVRKPRLKISDPL